MMVIRKSSSEDIDTIMLLIDGARSIMRADGNSSQWPEGTPPRGLIESDVARGVSYVCVSDGQPVGTFAFIPSPEPTYNNIFGGRWLNDEPYHVIHRIASRADVHGVFGAITAFCFARETNIRIDTHRDNRIMRHILSRCGFTYCGIIYLLNGDERLAYHKCLKSVIK